MSTVAEVVEVRHLTEHVLEMFLQPETPVSYAAGQWVSLLMPVGPKNRTKRSYSMASLMRSDGRLHLIFDHVPEGLGSSYLAGLEVGAKVDILTCMGNFVLIEDPQPNLLFVARYTGIVPIFAMLEQLAVDRYQGQIHLVYASPCRTEEILIDEMHALGLPGLMLHRLYLDESDEDRPEESIATALYQGAQPDEWNVYLCGVGALVRPLRKQFKILECPRSHIKAERYN